MVSFWPVPYRFKSRVLVDNYESHKVTNVSKFAKKFEFQRFKNLWPTKTQWRVKNTKLWLCGSQVTPCKFEDPHWHNEIIGVQTVLEMENHNFKYTLLYEIYNFFFGLIGTMLNKTLAEKNIHICIFPKSSQRKM